MGFFKKLKEKFVKEDEHVQDDSSKREDVDNLKDDPDKDEQQELSTSTEEDEVKEDFTETTSEEVVEEQPKEEEVVEATPVEEQEVQQEVHEEVQEEIAEEVEEKESISTKFKKGLEKTRNSFATKVNDLVARYRTVDEDFFEELEEILISADVGVNTVMHLIDELKMEVKRRNIKDTREVREVISEKLVDIYYGNDDEEIEEITFNQDGLTVLLFVGVNGVGKTTTIGKMAHRLKQQGKNVVMAAGDTFRAGAIEQLEVWGDRVGVPVIRHSEGSDPAAVIYDGIQSAKSKGADVLLCDTAGRLQNKVNLMNELSKVKRVIEREIPGAPHESLLVLDATTGQNALSQAKTFSEATNVSGIVLTKLDGTAKGGIVMAIRNELDIPVKFVGLGEKVTDLQSFDAHAFVYGLFADMLEESEQE
ncbi:signal recognition particle-docking protein FtsY [Pontibacillus sp. ALD_SL1]|uniref:signal recognition particle-docking protein FtsY n=1 Tax=Pontibacillus sp. ALD_SL1 TaxID=2777185 RepID=UPI001A969FBC|nr:signal recognition particle-docking protein FtsY [Pontibacillus sp. ALD_SL1]QST01557.1 signal recognition particle-docking protein FtsY [Pontibacillus sp. ALD_SL1]